MGNQHRVLIAEDDQTFANELKDTFVSENYDVIHASDGTQAIEILQKEKPDIGFIDLVMPDVDGLDVLRQAQRIAPDVPLIMITGFASIDRAVEATRLGAYDFIEKPVTLDRLLLTARHALEKRHLATQNRWMLKDIMERYEMVGKSKVMQTVYTMIDKVAPTSTSVLITGETGTGKELVARALHMRSRRQSEPFIKINCAAIPDNLIESELFGHKRGSFTGATFDKLGKFVQANGGALFLDEIGNMSQAAQSKILRALETKEIEAVGDTFIQKVDVRVIAATNSDVQSLVDNSGFREDLYYRLKDVHIHVPPLREHKEDIPNLANHFLRESCEEHNRCLLGFEDKAIMALMEYTWPGNVRQLRSVVNKLVIFAESDKIKAGEVLDELQSGGKKPDAVSYRRAMAQYETTFLTNTLSAYDWNVAKAAAALGIDRTNLHKKMQKLGIQREEG